MQYTYHVRKMFSGRDILNIKIVTHRNCAAETKIN